MTNERNFRKIEIAIMSAKRENNIQRVEDIRSILIHHKKVLDMKLDSVMKGSGFETSKPFMKMTSDYSQIARLSRVVDAYGRS